MGRDGGELFYRTLGGQLISVPVLSRATLETGTCPPLIHLGIRIPFPTPMTVEPPEPCAEASTWLDSSERIRGCVQPVVQERVNLFPDGLVRIMLKKAYVDGTVAVDMDPLSLLCRLATTVSHRASTP